MRYFSVMIERGIAGLLVAKTFPPDSQLSKVFANPSRSKRYSEAVGYGARLAGNLGVPLFDKTGRLTAAECALLANTERQTKR